jgi:plasmid stability protein
VSQPTPEPGGEPTTEIVARVPNATAEKFRLLAQLHYRSVDAELEEAMRAHLERADREAEASVLTDDELTQRLLGFDALADGLEPDDDEE